MTIGTVALSWRSSDAGALVAYRARREAHAEEVQILQGVRRVCKLATVEMSLADYAKKKVPKSVDLPFTKEAEAFLFYAGIVSAGFDICDAPSGIAVNHAERQVRITLPPPRILSIDIQRFETINEDSGFLNAIAPEDRNRWYSRGAVRAGARRAGAGRARSRADSRRGAVRGVRRAARLHAGDRQRAGPARRRRHVHAGIGR